MLPAFKTSLSIIFCFPNTLQMVPRQLLLGFSYLPPPPPPLIQDNVVVFGGGGGGSSHSSNNLNLRSIMMITTIVIGVVVLSATIHLLLRYINSHCNLIESDEEDEVVNIEPAVHVHHRGERISSRRVAPDDYDHQNLIDSLPLFSFNSINNLRSTTTTTADCAVCLSKFEQHDQLRLLPICCHAFHSTCIDTWLASNHTCPLCRSTIHIAESDGYLKLFSASNATENSSSRRSDSFRIEIGSVSRRRVSSDSGRFRSYSMGSFEYLVDDELEVEVVVEPQTQPHSDGGRKDGGEVSSSETSPPGSDIAADVADGRGWLKDYVDRLVSSSSSSLSSRSRSFSGRFFTGSGRRRSDGGSWDLEGNGFGEEISSFFRWLSGV